MHFRGVCRSISASITTLRQRIVGLADERSAPISSLRIVNIAREHAPIP